jgi:magnesium and cobalt exporter, CNNM family
MENYILEFSILFIFLILSAFFSGSETAFFSLTKTDLHGFSLSDKVIEKSIYRTMLSPDKILITILIGNLFVNLAVTTLTTKLMLQRWENWGHIISILIITPVIILLCEITPKLLSIKAYESVSKKIYPLLNFFHLTLYPVRWVMTIVTNFIIWILNLKLDSDSITENEITSILNKREKEGVIEKKEGVLISNVIRFSKKEGINIMFHRNKARFLSYDASINEAMKVFIESDIIRAPIYKDDLDHVIGMVDSKDLIPYYMGFGSAKNINRFIQPVDFFPASMELNDLLNHFLSKRIQIAILVDEYGGTAGVITLNSILSELMGMKFSKWDVNISKRIKKINEGITVISGEMQIDDFNFHFKEDIKSIESDTVGGYIIEKMTFFPKRGEEISIQNYRLRVRYILKNKVETIEVIRKK